ncbi:protease m1 zinc metalloprotease [Anopheles darlingi]|uniref:Protease m1 zinc metalloprotease n=1 Tax=Anopheles darlingi TaxID=43151 RepID=W5JFV9_ANODA|nr:protease m1 zinc metalloprotease [Anopheles darlingi]
MSSEERDHKIVLRYTGQLSPAAHYHQHYTHQPAASPYGHHHQQQQQHHHHGGPASNNNNNGSHHQIGPRSEYMYAGVPPVADHENDEYERKGGCFVSICRGISIAVLIFVLIFFLSFTIFFSTKYAYEHKPNLTLEDFLNHRAYLIDKRSRIPKHVIPKHYRLFVEPVFNETSNPFSYSGIVWVTVTSKKPNNKRIELNVKNLRIRMEDVAVLKSIRLTNMDFDEDLDWDLSEEDLYSLPRLNRRRRRRRQAEPTVNMASRPDNRSATAMNPVERHEDERQGDPQPENSAREVTDDEDGEGEAVVDVTLSSSPPPPPKPVINSDSTENATVIDKSKFYHHPVFPADDFVTIKILDLEFDESNEKMIIFLGTEMKKDIYYIVKVNFTGNMTNDKGLYYTHYEDDGPAHKHFAAAVLEPNNARRLYPCMDDHNFRSPFELNIARRSNMNSASSLNLEMSEPMEEGDLVVDTYNTTGMVRASEIGFVVTDMVPERYNITQRVSLLAYTRTRYDEHIKNTTDIFSRVIHIYEQYLGVLFPYETIRYVTIPNADHSIYEIKEGMILSSEKRLINADHYFPPVVPGVHLVQVVVANELAKLLIHNLADYKNKETYWLHESIPLYLESLALRNLTAAGSTVLDDFLLEGRLRSMREEMNTKTSALNIFTNHWEEDTHFELVKYKGLSVLRMMNYTLGVQAFDRFLSDYFRLRNDSESIDVIDILSRDSHSRLDEVFSSFLHSWSSLEKYPIINIRHNNASGYFELRQIPLPFEEEIDQLWTVPVTFINNTNHRLFAEKVRWLTDSDNLLEIKSSGMAFNNGSWIIINPSGIGYYRVNYEPQHWIQLAHVLNRHFHKLPYTTRAIIVDDALNLARLGLLNYSIAFNVVSFVKKANEDYQPWKLVLSNLEFVMHATEDLPNFHHVERFLEYLIVAKYEEIRRAGNTVRYNPLVEELIVQWACKLGVNDCVRRHRELFEEIFNRTRVPFALPEEQLQRILCTTIRYSGLTEWKQVEQEYLRTDDINYQRMLVKSLGCTREIRLIKRLLGLLRHPRFSMYTKEILTSISENKVALKYTMDYLYNEWIEVRRYLTLYDISILLRSISNKNEFLMYEQIFFRYSYTFQTMDKEILKRMRDMIMKLLRWREEVAPIIEFEPFHFEANEMADTITFL